MAPRPTMPSPTTMATTIRMILSVLLPDLAGAATGWAAAAAPQEEQDCMLGVNAAPHRAQTFAMMISLPLSSRLKFPAWPSGSFCNRYHPRWYRKRSRPARAGRLNCRHDGRKRGVRRVPNAPETRFSRLHEGLVLMVCVMEILVLPPSREGFAVTVTMTDSCLLFSNVIIALSAVSMTAVLLPNLPL